MVHLFKPPSWAPVLPSPPPDSIPICDFVIGDERYGRHPLAESKAPYTCGLSGKTYSAVEVKQRVDHLSRALATVLGWSPNAGTPEEKVIATYSVNTVDNMTVAWATHRLYGISAPINAAYSTAEVEHQLVSTGARALFTCLPLLSKALEAAAHAGIPREKIFLLEVPAQLLRGAVAPSEFKTVDQLVKQGSELAPLPSCEWQPGQGKRQTAFLCASSGTSGLPKNVIIPHYNVIANILQGVTFEEPHRKNGLEVALGLLPQSHSFSLVLISHMSVYRGDGVIILPNFDLQQMLKAAQDHAITRLYVVPAMVVAMTKNPQVLLDYNLDSVTSLVIGAAPLNAATAKLIGTFKPTWKILQGYGLTETSVVATCTSLADLWPGSCGQLLPGYEARLVTEDGADVDQYDVPGELWFRSPSIVPGYKDNPAADAELFAGDGWMRTGDVAVVRKSEAGHEHFFIVDRLKELIKVKGNQVAPAELETLLCLHDDIAEAAVIPIPDYTAGEVPRAYIVRTPQGLAKDPEALAAAITEYVKVNTAPFKQLKGGVEFVEALPKGPSGKVLRKQLKDQARAKAKEMEAVSVSQPQGEVMEVVQPGQETAKVVAPGVGQTTAILLEKEDASASKAVTESLATMQISSVKAENAPPLSGQDVSSESVDTKQDVTPRNEEKPATEVKVLQPTDNLTITKVLDDSKGFQPPTAIVLGVFDFADDD